MVEEGVELPSLAVESKECLTCGCVKPMGHYRRDSSITDGRSMQCESCRAVPRMSTAEHVARVRERNYNMDTVKNSRWKHQDDYRDDRAREGRSMHAHDFLYYLRKLVGENGLKLFWMDGNIPGDIALFRIFRTGPEYLMYMPTQYRMPEFSQYEFDDKDVLVKETKRGWRTLLLRLIKTRVITEDESKRVFGDALGPAAKVWHRQLFIHRNGKEPS